MYSTDENFYLSSREGYNLDKPHKCTRIRKLHSETRNNLLLVKISPSLIGQQYDLGDQDIDEVILATRFKDESLFPINTWPVYVYVLRMINKISEGESEIKDKNMTLIAWAELYPDEISAEEKVVK